MKRIVSLLMVLPAMAMLAACSTNPATGEQSFTAFMSKEREIQVGAEEHPKMLKQFGGAYDDRKLAAYVRDMGMELANQSEMPELPWTFTLLNDPMVNAFALPGGYVYVTRGLMALASSEAELAGVLSHEIGHVTARHTAQRYSSAVAANIGVQVLGVLSQAAGLGGAGGDIAALGANLALKSYSREQELESDMLGVRYMTRVGYDTSALVSFFEKMRAHQAIEIKKRGGSEAEVDQNNIMATHPRTADRIQQAIDLAESSKPGTRVGRDAYLARIDGMIFGDDPDQGVIRGQQFIHPKLNFRFEAPPGYKIINTPDLVVAVNEAQDVLLKFAGAPAKKVREFGGLKGYLAKGWGGADIALGPIENITINGMAAVTGSGQVRTNKGLIDVRRILIKQNRDTYWRFQFETPANKTARLNEVLRRMTYSFRAPTPEELKMAEPRRVRIVEVAPGQTTADLIATMAVEGDATDKADWFRALNGIAPDAALMAGQKVKIVR